MHQAMLDCDLPQLLRNFADQSVDLVPRALHVTSHFVDRRPIRRLVPWQLSRWRIDPERKKLVELRLEGRHVQRVARNQVPVECLQMSQVEDHPVALGDRSLVEEFRLDQPEQRVGILAGLLECAACFSLGPHKTALSIT